ncbi:hypothetical protein CLF_109434 [Clonorchis sinensis]|uniref:Uncharacterized protein n=1 Tax=Clonorchis sinensis TaxID=79923 RepID=G7YSL7_CLOSI|nr:hypothetical protein CLF_109434 [Clonorchis sinensis]
MPKNLRQLKTGSTLTGWYLQRNESLLDQIVSFNTFFSLKALQPDYAVILRDPGIVRLVTKLALFGNRHECSQKAQFTRMQTFKPEEEPKMSIEDRVTEHVALALMYGSFPDDEMPTNIKGKTKDLCSKSLSSRSWAIIMVYANIGPVLYSIGKTLVNALLFEGSPQNLSSVLQAVDPSGSIPTEDKLLILRLSKMSDRQLNSELVLLGESTVGKSNMVLSFVKAHFSELQEATIAVCQNQNPPPEFEQILAQNLLTVELVGRSYNKHRENHENMPEPALFEFPLPNDFSLYVWLFQRQALQVNYTVDYLSMKECLSSFDQSKQFITSVCESATYFTAFTPTPTKANFFDECEPLRISSQLSPTFRHLMRCPQISTSRNPDDITTDLFTFAGRTFYKSRKNGTSAVVLIPHLLIHQNNRNSSEVHLELSLDHEHTVWVTHNDVSIHSLYFIIAFIMFVSYGTIHQLHIFSNNRWTRGQTVALAVVCIFPQLSSQYVDQFI